MSQPEFTRSSTPPLFELRETPPWWKDWTCEEKLAYLHERVLTLAGDVEILRETESTRADSIRNC